MDHRASQLWDGLGGHLAGRGEPTLGAHGAKLDCATKIG